MSMRDLSPLVITTAVPAVPSGSVGNSDLTVPPLMVILELGCLFGLTIDGDGIVSSHDLDSGRTPLYRRCGKFGTIGKDEMDCTIADETARSYIAAKNDIPTG